MKREARCPGAAKRLVGRLVGAGTHDMPGSPRGPRPTHMAIPYAVA
jgi:hypothetical protein